MALVEIDDAVLERATAYEKMFDKIGKSEDRMAILKLVKKHYPDVTIPEIDAAAPYVGRIEALEKKLAERDQQEVEAKANRTIASARRKLREDGWDDEGIKTIEDRMQATGNPDYESASLWVKNQLPKDKPLPSTFSGQRYDWFTPPEQDDNTSLLLKNPKAFQDREVAKFLQEQRGRKTGVWGGQ